MGELTMTGCPDDRVKNIMKLLRAFGWFRSETAGSQTNRRIISGLSRRLELDRTRCCASTYNHAFFYAYWHSHC